MDILAVPVNHLVGARVTERQGRAFSQPNSSFHGNLLYTATESLNIGTAALEILALQGRFSTCGRRCPAAHLTICWAYLRGLGFTGLL